MFLLKNFNHQIYLDFFGLEIFNNQIYLYFSLLKLITYLVESMNWISKLKWFLSKLTKHKSLKTKDNISFKNATDHLFITSVYRILKLWYDWLMSTPPMRCHCKMCSFSLFFSWFSASKYLFLTFPADF